MGVEDELGAVMAERGSRTEIPGGYYVNLWSGIGVALENNQAVANLIGRIAQQVKVTAGSVKQAIQRVNQASVKVASVRAQVVVVSKKQSDEEVKVGPIGGQLLQLNHFLANVQQDLQQHKSSTGGRNLPSSAPPPPVVPLQVNDTPVEDAVMQLQLELQVVQSRLRSESASIGGHVFESYKDTLKWVVTNYSPEDWQYVMDIPAVYSLVRPDGQIYNTLHTLCW
jgi:hypothetical protein